MITGADHFAFVFRERHLRVDEPVLPIRGAHLLHAADHALRDEPIGRRFTFQIPLLAAFPFKQAVTPKTDTLAALGSDTFINDGTVPAFPVVTVGAMGGTVDLVIDGRHFTTSSLPGNAVIDMWARTIKDSTGTDISPWPKFSETEWLAFPPGSSLVEQAGIALLSITHHDTYA